jgi:hypothetical protein
MGGHLNPWLALPTEPPYLLPCDSEIIRTYNATHADQKYLVQDRVLPEPFVGKTTAPVVLLNLNPGFEDGNIEEHARKEFQALVRGNYSQESAAFPLYYLDPSFEGGGESWCEGKLRWLLELFGSKKLARSLLFVEYFPYHSRRFDHAKLELPSQEYGFDLVRSAIARGAVVVVMRGRTLWTRRIPELASYPRAFRPKSSQGAWVSPGNCEGFDAIVSAIREEDRQTLA